jgi:hypothetical protein
MVLKDHDLRQLDEERIRDLKEKDPEALVNLSIRLLEDLKDARERLNQNPSNSSRPPSTQAPWFRAREDEEDTEAPSDDEHGEDPPEEAPAEPPPTGSGVPAVRIAPITGIRAIPPRGANLDASRAPRDSGARRG